MLVLVPTHTLWHTCYSSTVCPSTIKQTTKAMVADQRKNIVAERDRLTRLRCQVGGRDIIRWWNECQLLCVSSSVMVFSALHLRQIQKQRTPTKQAPVQSQRKQYPARFPKPCSNAMCVNFFSSVTTNSTHFLFVVLPHAHAGGNS